MEGVKNIVCQLVTVSLIRLLVPGSAHPATTQPGPACEAHLLPWLSTQSFVFLTSHARSESRPEAGDATRRRCVDGRRQWRGFLLSSPNSRDLWEQESGGGRAARRGGVSSPPPGGLDPSAPPLPKTSRRPRSHPASPRRIRGEEG
jgi:hypothetical protein